MSRKDYRLLATALNDTLKYDTSGPKTQQAVVATAQNIAWALKRDNGRFDCDRFYAACGIMVNKDGWLRYQRA